MKFSKGLFVTVALAIAVMMTGCKDSGEEFRFHVKNMTGTEISEIQIAPENNKSDYNNCLKENLAIDGEVEVSLGKLTTEDISEGFSLQVYNADDNSYGDFSMLMIKSGDTVSFYMDDWGLAVAVNMTEEEIEEQIASDHEDYISSLTENEEEASSEDNTDTQ